MMSRLSWRARALVSVSLLVSILAGAAPLARAQTEPTAYPGQTWEPPPEQYGAVMEEGRRVRMDDGTLLAVDIVFPTDPETGEKAEGPFPVLLNQDMYAGTYQRDVQPPTSYGDYFVKRGYIFVHVHDRGTGDSEGHYDPGFGPRVGLDGVELAYWVADPANVPGSNGQVGLSGCSALGVVQLTTLAALGRLLESNDSMVYVPGAVPDAPGKHVDVKAGHPIKAAIPECVGTSVYHEQYTDNGVPSFIVGLALAQPAAQAVLIGYNTKDPSSNYEQSIRSLDMMANGEDSYYRTHWRERDFIRRADDIGRTGVPVLTWVGWQEGGPIGSQPLYAALQNASAGRPITSAMLPACDDPSEASTGSCQVSSPKYQALIGDWSHAEGSDRGIELQWFETWVRGLDTGLEKADEGIHLKELPSATTERWINATSYPMTTDYTALYLAGDGTMSTTAPTAPSTAQLAWPAGPAVTFDAVEAADVDRTILGPPAVRLRVSSSNTNIHLFTQLTDVAPDGTETPITHGSILGSRRATDPERSWSDASGLPILPYLRLDRDDYLTPDETVTLDVPLQPTAWRLVAGHTLRLKVATNAGEKCSPTGVLFAPPAGCFFSAQMAASLAGGLYTLELAGGSVLNVPLIDSTDIKTATSAVTGTSDNDTVEPIDWGSGGARPSN